MTGEKLWCWWGRWHSGSGSISRGCAGGDSSGSAEVVGAILSGGWPSGSRRAVGGLHLLWQKRDAGLLVHFIQQLQDESRSGGRGIDTT